LVKNSHGSPSIRLTKLSRFSNYPDTLLSADRGISPTLGQAIVMFIGEAEVRMYVDRKSLIAVMETALIGNG